jgi:hypothetical protein
MTTEIALSVKEFVANNPDWPHEGLAQSICSVGFDASTSDWGSPKITAYRVIRGKG